MPTFAIRSEPPLALLFSLALVAQLLFSPSAHADPPIDTWDSSADSPPAPPAANTPPPPNTPPAPKHVGRSVDIEVQPRRRRVIRRRRRRVDLSSLRAHNYGDKITVGLFTGYKYFTDNAQLGNTTDTSVRAQSGVMFGFRTGYNLTRYIGIQGELGYQPSKYFDNGNTAHLVGLRGFLMLHIPAGVLRPFILVGGGVEMLTAKVDGVDIDYDGAFIGGLGTKYDLSNSMSLRVDVRGLSTDGVVNGTVNWEVHAGLTFRFMVE